MQKKKASGWKHCDWDVTVEEHADAVTTRVWRGAVAMSSGDGAPMDVSEKLYREALEFRQKEVEAETARREEVLAKARERAKEMMMDRKKLSSMESWKLETWRSAREQMVSRGEETALYEQKALVALLKVMK